MRAFTRHPRARWAAPVLAAALVVGGVVTAQSSAGGQSDLAPRTAHDLLVALQGARPVPLSGTVVQHMDLGLPAVPSGALGGSAAGGGLDPVSLLSGSHTWRVWYSDPSHARLALVDGSDEYDVVRNGSDLWQWSSTDQSVVHGRVPATGSGQGHSSAAPPASPDGAPGLPELSTPDAAASWVLRQLDRTTRVETTRTDRVAGRPAYGLVLTPRTPGTRIGSVHVSLDARTSLPLAVTVLPRGSRVPAVDVRFDTLRMAAPASSVFAFRPPPGATVTTPEAGSPARPGTSAGATAPEVRGSGWSTVVVGRLPAPSPRQGSKGTDPLAALDAVLPRVSGAWGSGHLLSTRLFTAVLTTDRRFALGAVDASTLYAALGS